ncbi:MAG: hypothetical protein J3Q66DRAFT_287165 [Benniella sp.]|nr:MAG: hypothetical protein J3Q66DRAFT_287165 [Benniella sp.]
MYDQECVGGPVGNRTFSQCCGNGAISLPLLSFIPEIVEILGQDTKESTRFRSRSRKYNAVLSFTSMGVNVDERLANGRNGVYTFRICGQVVHRIGSFLPVHGHQPAFSQIYIRDTEEQADIRLQVMNDLDRYQLLELQAILMQKNPFCRVYRSIGEREQQLGADAVANLRIVMRSERNQQENQQHINHRQYDRPTSAEVAVLLPGEQVGSRRDIIIQARDGDLQRIAENHLCYDPLHYVLLHPNGEHGWSFNAYRKRPVGPNQPQPNHNPGGDPDDSDGEGGRRKENRISRDKASSCRTNSITTLSL